MFAYLTQIMKDIVLPDIYFLICEIIVVKMQEKEKSCVYYAWGNGNNEKNAAYGIRNGTVSGIFISSLWKTWLGLI